MRDLRSLRVTGKSMLHVCKQKHIAQSIPVQRALEREWYAVPQYNREYRNDLIRKLAEAGNKEACFRDGLRIIFDENRDELVCPEEMLQWSADGGHNLAAYTLAVCLYRPNGDAGDNEKAKALLRKLEGEDGPGAAAAGGIGAHRRWRNRACVVARLESVEAAEVYQPPYIDNWFPIAKPECSDAHIGCGNCGQPLGKVDWLEFCSEECRIHFECKTFFIKYFW
ncbi:unnamed protein product [Urochloa humidicola]